MRPDDRGRKAREPRARMRHASEARVLPIGGIGSHFGANVAGWPPLRGHGHGYGRSNQTGTHFGRGVIGSSAS
jgi:hypothetical protein